MIKTALFSLILFMVLSCVNLYDPNIQTTTQRLVVESHLSTKLGYQYVYLTFDSGYNNEESNFKNLVQGAKISISDDRGSIFGFIDEIEPSNQIKTRAGYNYRSLNKFKAEVGRKYILTIETLTGKKYQSEPELVPPVPKITSIKSEFVPVLLPVTVSGNFTITLDTDDPANTENYYMWRSYHVKLAQYCREWYNFGSGGSVTVGYLDPCCDPCYEKVKCEDCYELADDRLINGKKIVGQYIDTVPFKDAFPYYIVIEQYSLNKNAYKFWRSLKQQSKNSGGIFDATPRSLIGNIKNIADPKEEVLGYFTVSDLAEIYYNVDRKRQNPKLIPYTENSNFVKTDVCYPCQESYKQSKIKPEGFQQ